MLNLADLQKQFNDNGVIFTYNGYLSHEILTNIIQALEERIGTLNVFNQSAQTIFTIFIEMTQNMINYFAGRRDDGDKECLCEGIIVLGFDKEKEKIYLKSGNLVQPEDVAKITERIDSVTGLDKDELRARFRDLRKTGKNRSARGAGLGFLEIQRKASEPINYSFIKMENSTLLFSLDVYL